MTEPTDPIDAIRAITRRPIDLRRVPPPEVIDHEPSPVVDIAPPARRHVEDAEGLLDEAAQWLVDNDAQALATMALAEATLALAAQQRIANLIAWEDLTRESNRATVRRELEP